MSAEPCTCRLVQWATDPQVMVEFWAEEDRKWIDLAHRLVQDSNFEAWLKNERHGGTDCWFYGSQFREGAD